MVENMPSNKAYRYATENGDPDGRILEDFRSRYIAYRKAWKNQPRQAINNKLTGNKFEQARFTPLSVDIEVAAVCDLACPFCYRQELYKNYCKRCNKIFFFYYRKQLKFIYEKANLELVS